MSRAQRDKGARIERELVNRHEEIGVHAERVPLSGATRYQEGGHDIDVYPFGVDECPLVFEIKARGSGDGFRMLERWLGENDGLFLRRDGDKPLVVLPWETYELFLKELAAGVKRSRHAKYTEAMHKLGLHTGGGNGKTVKAKAPSRKKASS